MQALPSWTTPVYERGCRLQAAPHTVAAQRRAWKAAGCSACGARSHRQGWHSSGSGSSSRSLEQGPKLHRRPPTTGHTVKAWGYTCTTFRLSRVELRLSTRGGRGPDCPPWARQRAPLLLLPAVSRRPHHVRMPPAGDDERARWVGRGCEGVREVVPPALALPSAQLHLGHVDGPSLPCFSVFLAVYATPRTTAIWGKLQTWRVARAGRTLGTACVLASNCRWSRLRGGRGSNVV